MLSKNDLKQIKEVVEGSIRPLDLRLERVETRTEETQNRVSKLGTEVEGLSHKIDKVASDVKELKLETKGIHLILERQEKDFSERIERLEQNAEPN